MNCPHNHTTWSANMQNGSCKDCGMKIMIDGVKVEMIQKIESIEGHGHLCYYCKEPCNGLAGNPDKWPIPLCHSDDPGVVKWHHIGCVRDRLIENYSMKDFDIYKWSEEEKAKFNVALAEVFGWKK